MNHYGMLDKELKEKWKLMMKMIEDEENQPGVDLQSKTGLRTYGPANFDHFNNRNDKIALFKRKKEIEGQLDLLRDYKDEDMKREFYMSMLYHSILRSIE